MLHTRLLLVDDHPAVLDYLVARLEPEFVIVGRVTSGAEVLGQVTKLSPHIIILDLNLGDMNGFQVIAALRKRACAAKVIFLSLHDDPAFVQRALELSASGYVFKAQIADLAEAIRLVRDGGIYTPPTFVVQKACAGENNSNS